MESVNLDTGATARDVENPATRPVNIGQLTVWSAVCNEQDNPADVTER